MNRSERHTLHRAAGEERRNRAMRRQAEKAAAQARDAGVVLRDTKGRFAAWTDGQPHLLDLLRVSVKTTRKDDRPMTINKPRKESAILKHGNTAFHQAHPFYTVRRLDTWTDAVFQADHGPIEAYNKALAYWFPDAAPLVDTGNTFVKTVIGKSLISRTESEPYRQLVVLAHE